MSGRWVEVVPWDRQGNNNLTNTAYVLSFCRRYRIERPKRLRGADDAAKAGRDGVPRRVFDGDYDEADCPKRAWQRTMAHDTIVDALCRFLDPRSAQIDSMPVNAVVTQTLRQRYDGGLACPPAYRAGERGTQ